MNTLLVGKLLRCMIYCGAAPLFLLWMLMTDMIVQGSMYIGFKFISFSRPC